MKHYLTINRNKLLLLRTIRVIAKDLYWKKKALLTHTQIYIYIYIYIYALCACIYLTFFKWQNYRDRLEGDVNERHKLWKGSKRDLVVKKQFYILSVDTCIHIHTHTSAGKTSEIWKSSVDCIDIIFLVLTVSKISKFRYRWWGHVLLVQQEKNTAWIQLLFLS